MIFTSIPAGICWISPLLGFQVDGLLIVHAGVKQASDLIRGTVGSMMCITLRKKCQGGGFKLVDYRIKRFAVPGGSTEVLGMLFSAPAPKVYKEQTQSGALLRRSRPCTSNDSMIMWPLIDNSVYCSITVH